MGLVAKMKRGEPIGNQNCYGYIWNSQTKKHEINEEQDQEQEKDTTLFTIAIKAIL